MRVRRRMCWVEVALATVSGLFCVLTLVWHDWIEIVFHVDPDHGAGWFEWLIVVVSATLTVAFATVAWRDRGNLATQGHAE